MRSMLLLLMGLAIPTFVLAAPVRSPLAEVRAAFMRYDQGWRDYDAAEILSQFAPNFEWTNSVGLRFTRKTDFGNFLEHLFANPRFRAGVPGPLVIHELRLLSPDVAVVSSSEVTDGQQVWNTGKTVPHQHTNELTVMERRGGQWLIVFDLESDEANGI
jgi:uncharacterized protein (TIGR02246 family)